MSSTMHHALALKEDDLVMLSTDDLNYSEIIEYVRSPRAGAVATFLGTTRDIFESKRVSHLEYEAYESMAVDNMKEICSQIRARWQVAKVAMCHKLGSCPIGDISVVIAVSSEHRAEALEAVDYAINELKRSVVIWKKEVYENGQAAWKENVEQFSSSCVDDGKHRTIHTTFVETVESEVDVKTGHSNDNANASTNIVSKRSSISLSIVDFQRDADVDARVSTTGDNIHLKPMDSI